MFHSFKIIYQAEKYFGWRQKSFQRLACHQNKKKKNMLKKMQTFPDIFIQSAPKIIFIFVQSESKF